MPSRSSRSSSRPRSRSSTRSHSKPSSSSSSASSSGDKGGNTVVGMRGGKRKHKQGSNKKGRRKDKRPKDDLDEYRHLAHWYLRSEYSYTDWGNAITYGLRYEERKFGKLTRDRFEEKYALELQAFFTLKDHIPNFDKDLSKIKPKKQAAWLNSLGKMMNDAAGSTRGNDIKDLRDRGLAYLALDLPNKKLEPDIPPTSVKDQARGHNHPILSRLLTPVRLLEDFDEDPEEFRKKILHGAVKFNDEDFPSMLYPQPDGHDPDDLEANLLRNGTAVHFFKHIFTSPSSAIRDPGTKLKGRRGQAKINNMTEVTPGSIAYSYLMYWYNISAISDWRTEDPLTDCSELYTMVFGLFEEREDDDDATIQWRKDTLDWWNLQVFGIIPENQDDESEDQAKVTTLQLLRQQRAQKTAAVAAAATESPAPAATEAAADIAASSDVAGGAGTPGPSSAPSTMEANSTTSTTSSDPTSAPSGHHQRSTPPPSSAPSSSFPPIHIPQVATPPRSSPVPNPSLLTSRRPLTPARHVNIGDTNLEASPVLWPVKYSRKANHTSASSKEQQSRR